MGFIQIKTISKWCHFLISKWWIVKGWKGIKICLIKRFSKVEQESKKGGFNSKGLRIGMQFEGEK